MFRLFSVRIPRSGFVIIEVYPKVIHFGAKAGIQEIPDRVFWIPAFTGMTG